MPLDAVFLSALTNELREKIEGGRIDKIQQPSKDMVLISLRAKGENRKLLLSAGTGNARIHLTKASFENPVEAPMFCMLLRKHLIGAHISAVHQPDNERLVIIELDTRDEMGYESKKRLVAELIGRSANLILLDADGRIIDCIRRMEFGGDVMRRMLPGMLYRLPPVQRKPALLNTEREERSELIRQADRGLPADKWLLNTFSGLSPLVCRELVHRAGNDYDMLPDMLDAFCDSMKAGEWKPYIVFDGKKPMEFSIMPVSQYGSNGVCEERESFSALLDEFFSVRDRLEQQRRRGNELTKKVKTARDRQQRKLAGQREELKLTEDREIIRKKAELITANMYAIRKGDRVLRCQDYYDENCPEIEIELNPLKSPQENAELLFKEYNKMKAARKHLTVLIEEGEKQLDYLNSVLELLGTAESEKDLSDIRRELLETGLVRVNKSKKPDKGRAQAPLCFISDDGFEILVGRSNVQNDELTLKMARRSDFWLHTQKIHGSHVIIRCNDTEPGETALNQAAVIAAYYSQGRGAGKIPVDYTMIRYVKKPSGSLPGKVVYTDYKTLMAESDEELVKRLKK